MEKGGLPPFVTDTRKAVESPRQMVEGPFKLKLPTGICANSAATGKFNKKIRTKGNGMEVVRIMKRAGLR